ncbi:hypothetical protein [Paenibacillus rigui]|uniref:Uncharacterized protein n=1 Tax=Paenibacillus rigui TaxID=554312 RepID=A0A229UXE1_9BACL|nr:hypothetical protein [Paenibacillus rigui]OXM88088.1 hypothetical protein CF651_03090 [Paenibacillus rigui]
MRHDEEVSEVHSGYEDLFIQFSKMVEKWILRALALILGLLVISQLLIQIPVIRYYLVKVEQLEGIRFQRSSGSDSAG